MERTRDLEDVLGDLRKAATSNGAKVSVGEIIDAFGRRSFGPLIFLCGLLGMTPVAAVPTVPTILATITALIAAQLLFGRDSIWIPRAIENLSLNPGKVEKAADAARKPARSGPRAAA